MRGYALNFLLDPDHVCIMVGVCHIEEQGIDMAMQSQEVIRQLTRIADALNTPAPMQVREGDALKAWGMRLYEEEFLNALERLGIEVV